MTHSSDDKPQDFQMPDPVILGRALMDAYEKAQPLFEEYMKKFENEDFSEKFASVNFDPLNVRESYLQFLDKITADPSKFMEIQAGFAQDWMELWQESMNRFMGNPTQSFIEPEKGDRRFRAAEWQESALFDYIKQSYLLTCRHMEKMVRDVDGLPDKQKDKLSFQTKLFANAMSPTNFFLTNPEVLTETMKTGGQNLIKGFENLIKDLERGRGDLRLSTTNYEAFELGKNIAMTKGRVVYQNDLMQLIQYSPQTEEFFETPLLIVPPWINKYYILDLRPDNSFIEWAVKQGHCVFVVSWVNPDKALAAKDFEDYMHEGVLAALTQVEKACNTKQTNMIGYCLGGTLTATTLAYLTEKKQEKRVKSVTFFTTMLDFKYCGDMMLFLDDEQLEVMERDMAQKGFLDGAEMQRTFSLMRANDLIWSFVVNNYLMGREPFPFDLLFWNDDYTNMPAAMHSFYLRNMYRDNKLAQKNGISVSNIPIDLSKIKTPTYFLSAKEDHIAPWIATYQGTQLLGGEITFTLAASGHIAGVVNPPQKQKYCYWLNDKTPEDHNEWLESAVQHEGSWWPHWGEWIKDFSGKKVEAFEPADGIEAAPGSYVKVRF